MVVFFFMVPTPRKFCEVLRRFDSYLFVSLLFFFSTQSSNCVCSRGGLGSSLWSRASCHVSIQITRLQYTQRVWQGNRMTQQSKNNINGGKKNNGFRKGFFLIMVTARKKKNCIFHYKCNLFSKPPRIAAQCTTTVGEWRVCAENPGSQGNRFKFPNSLMKSSVFATKRCGAIQQTYCFLFVSQMLD